MMPTHDRLEVIGAVPGSSVGKFDKTTLRLARPAE